MADRYSPGQETFDRSANRHNGRGYKFRTASVHLSEAAASRNEYSYPRLLFRVAIMESGQLQQIIIGIHPLALLPLSFPPFT